MLQILSGTLHLTVHGSSADRLSKQHTLGKSIHSLLLSLGLLYSFVVGWGRACTHHSVCVEVREWLILLYFHPMTSRNQTQAFRLSGEDLNPLSPHTGPCAICFPKPTDTKSRALQITSYQHSWHTNNLDTTWEFKRNLGGCFKWLPIVTIHSVY